VNNRIINVFKTLSILAVVGALTVGAGSAWADVEITKNPSGNPPALEVGYASGPTLSVAVTGLESPVVYSWEENSSAILNTLNTYTVPSGKTAGTYVYEVTASGVLTDQPATETPCTDAEGTWDGSACTGATGEETASWTVTVNAAGGTPPGGPGITPTITFTSTPALTATVRTSESAQFTVAATSSDANAVSYTLYKSENGTIAGGVKVQGAAHDGAKFAIAATNLAFGVHYYYVEAVVNAGQATEARRNTSLLTTFVTTENAKIDSAVVRVWDAIASGNPSKSAVTRSLRLTSGLKFTVAGDSVKAVFDVDNKSKKWENVRGAADSALTLNTAKDSIYIRRPEFGFTDAAATVDIKVTYTAYTGPAADGSAVDDVITISVPKKADVSGTIALRDTVITWTGSQLRVGNPTWTAIGATGTFCYSYHSAEDAAASSVVGPRQPLDGATTGATFTGTATTVAQATTGAGAILGVTSVGDYWFKVRISSDAAGVFGEKILKFSVKGKAIVESGVSVLGTYAYTGTAQAVSVVVRDGNLTLAEGTDYVIVNKNDIINAGKDSLEIVGAPGSNYSVLDTVKKEITVAKKTVTANVVIADNNDLEKEYDGVDSVEVGKFEIALAGVVSTDASKITAEIQKALFTPNGNATVNASGVVGANGAVNAVVKIGKASPSDGDNYAFANGADTLTVRVAGFTIKKRSLVEDDVVETIPADLLYTGRPVTVGVKWSGTGLYNDSTQSGTLAIVYKKGGTGDTTSVQPDTVGTHTVLVYVKGGRNYDSNLLSVGNLVIGAQKRPALTEIGAGDYYHSQVVRLSVTPTFTVADDRDKATLSYRWLRNGVAVSGAADSAYRFTVDTLVHRPNTGVGADSGYFYRVVVTTKYPNQADAVDTSDAIKVVVKSGTVTQLDLATVVVSGEWVYDGAAKEPAGDQVRVSYGGTSLTAGDDYILEYANNLNAGAQAIVKVLGLKTYGGETQRPFTIQKKALEPAKDISFVSATIYNAATQPVKIVATQSEGGKARTGLGTITEALYITGNEEDGFDTSRTAPTDAGEYDVWVKIGSGANFTAYSEEFYGLGSYTVIPKNPVLADFSGFTLPAASIRYDGAPHGVTGEIKLPGTGYGSLEIRYNGDTTVPVNAGTYVVSVTVEGGPNYFTSFQLPLGSFTITASDAVASNDRVIPGGTNEVVVVAPVQVVAGEFTVGPNPVAKASGKVGFFWQGKAVKSGTLYVFDASGNLVTKVNVADKGIGTDRREIGSWNLTAKGAPVTEGTYLVKGALVGKDGGKVKVSSILSVAR
jgi:hypothetical protein